MSTTHDGFRADAAVATSLIDAPRRGGVFYGWIMLPIATLAIMITAPAQTFGVSAFTASFRESLGLSHTQLAGAYMLGTLLAAVPMFYVGTLMDRHGLRRTITVVIVLFGGVCILTSQVTGVVSLFFSFLFLRMLGQGALGLLSANALAFWFDRRLGTVEGLRHVGMAGTIAFFPVLSLGMIDLVGWRWTYALIGVGIWAVMLPLMLGLWRDRPEELGQYKDGRRALPHETGPPTVDDEQDTSLTLGEAMRSRAYWLVMISLALWATLGTALIFSIVSLFDSRGLGQTEVAWLFTVFAISLAAMHLVGGILADRLPLNLLLALGMGGFAATMAAAWGMTSPAWVLPLGVLLGASQGLLIAMMGPVWPRYFGRAHMGRIRGTSVTVPVAASSLGPLIMDGSYDLLGSYDAVLLLFVLLPLPMTLLGLFATVPARRRERLAAAGAA